MATKDYPNLQTIEAHNPGKTVEVRVDHEVLDGWWRVYIDGEPSGYWFLPVPGVPAG